MKKKFTLYLFLFLASCILIACEKEPDPEYLAYLLSRTQTAMAPTPTYTPEAGSRCDLFADEELSLVLYGIYPGDTTVKMYVKFGSGKVIGKEDDLDDGLPWEYSAKIGEVESFGCDILESEPYTGRLHCILPLPPEYKDAARPAEVHVNGCPEAILSIPKLSLTVEKTAGSGGSGGSSGSSSSIVKRKVPNSIFNLCGDSPAGTLCENPGAIAWCICMGGTWSCDNMQMFGSCDLP